MSLFIDCDKCGEVLSVDERETLQSFSTDFDYRVDDGGNLIEELIQQYIVYTCGACGGHYKFTYYDWEKRFRLRMAHQLLNIRKIHMLKNEINPAIIDEANGLDYCGQCTGYGGDGDGWCLSDVIKQCTIRKEDDGI